MSEITHMPSIKAPRRFRLGMFGASAAPIFWLGQLMLGYWISALTCYGSDHPTTIASGSGLRALLVSFDAVAILAALAGGLVSYRLLSASREREENTVEGRIRFLATWGSLSSACFLVAIVFTAIASVGVPLCVR
jgi:hypothetical protein